MLYNDTVLIKGLYFYDLFEDKQDFIDKVVDVGGDVNIGDLYDVLFNKYYYAESRYQMLAPFVHAIKFKLQVIWPAYVKQKGLIENIHQLTQEEIVDGDMAIVNQANNPNIPTVDPSTKPIPGLSSTQQTSLRKLNKLEALRLQYEESFKDYLIKIYNACDTLFVQILAPEVTIYPQGGN